MEFLFALTTLGCLIVRGTSFPLKEHVDCRLFDKYERIPVETSHGLRCLYRQGGSLNLGECRKSVEYKWRKVGSDAGFQIMTKVGAEKCVDRKDSHLVLTRCGKKTWRYANHTLTNERTHLIAGVCSYDTETKPSICKRYEKEGKTFLLLHHDGSTSVYAQVDEKGRPVKVFKQSNADTLSRCHRRKRRSESYSLSKMSKLNVQSITSTGKSGSVTHKSMTTTSPSKSGSSTTEAKTTSPSKSGSSTTEAKTTSPSKSGSSTTETTGSSTTEAKTTSASKSGSSTTEAKTTSASKSGSSTSDSMTTTSPSKSGSSTTEAQTIPFPVTTSSRTLENHLPRMDTSRSVPPRPNFPSNPIIKYVIGLNQKFVKSTIGTDVLSTKAPQMTSKNYIIADRIVNPSNGSIQLTNFQLLTLVLAVIFVYF